MKCAMCNGTGWVVTDRGATKCECSNRPAIVQQIPEIHFEDAVAALSVLAYFPPEPRARLLIMDALKAMCPNSEALAYVVRRTVNLFRKWDDCGIPGLRAVLACKYVPADGIPAEIVALYPDGVPPEPIPAHRSLQAAPQSIALPPGRVTADSKLDARVKEAAGPVLGPQRRPIRQQKRDKEFRELLEGLETPPHLRNNE